MRDTTSATVSNAPNPSPISRRKLRANRRNAEKSTGPRTPEGKARASRNATTHGVFCRDVVVPGEDRAGFVHCRMTCSC